MIDRLTNKYDYDVLIDSVPRLKLRRTITELGICDQFNSELSHFFAPELLMYDRIPTKRTLFEVNYFDANPHIVLNDLENSNVGRIQNIQMFENRISLIHLFCCSYLRFICTDHSNCRKFCIRKRSVAPYHNSNRFP